ncbi:MAG: FAD-dependent oxidoreductase [Candidatus Moranbacteria bacterium]|nr:FAD-dependent oxidoreductase [Candidatus Moranbacteria bacterium]
MKDFIIIGIGPAGLAASIYASRYNLDVLVLGEENGGCMNESYNIENYPGFSSISGFELGQKMKEHADKLGGKIKQEKVTELEKIEGGFKVSTNTEEYQAKRVLLATGTVFRKLGISGEDKFSGHGVSYCATCDGPFFKEKKVAVVGGGNSALNAALLLSKYAKEVKIFFRADKSTAIPRYLKQVEAKDNIELVPKTNLLEIKGSQKVEKIVLDNAWKKSREHQFDGVFVEIGSRPDNAIFKDLSLELDKMGYIVVNKDQSTSVEGLFAAGDITDNSNGYRQIITACSEGAIAVAAINDLVQNDK